MRETDLTTQYYLAMLILLIVIAVCAVIWWVIHRDIILEAVYFVYCVIIFLAIAIPLCASVESRPSREPAVRPA